MHTLTPAKLAMAAAATVLAAGIALAPITYALDVVDWQGTDISNAQAQMLVWAGVDYNHPGSNDWRSAGEQSGNDYSSGIPPNFSRLTIAV